MTLEVRFFASLVERTGCSVETVEVVPGQDVEALWRELLRRHPRLRDLGFRPLVACDRSYATWSDSLDDVAEVAFLPPVSGG
ncbi:MAG: MoaD/ThiS family protein [bacterium]|nr:MoaD/ThiS family protein [bacterium]